MQQANAGSWTAGPAAERPLGFGRTASSNDNSAARRAALQPWPVLMSQGTDDGLKMLREDGGFGGSFGVGSKSWEDANPAALVGLGWGKPGHSFVGRTARSARSEG